MKNWVVESLLLLTVFVATTFAFQQKAFWAKTPQNTIRQETAKSTSLRASFFDQLKTTLSGEKTLQEEDFSAFRPDQEGLVRQAKKLLATDFGLQDPTLLDDDFVAISAYEDTALAKTEFLVAGNFFDVRTAFPDLDYRAYDFRVDVNDENCLRMTCRTTGTMRGPLQLRGEILEPTGNFMKCPPECVSMFFDKDSGKLKKLLYPGFIMDRQIGNTGGTTGVLAAATIGGKPPSDIDLYPLGSVVGRFFGRPVPQIPESKEVLAPFPEQVMVSLARGVITASFGANDPSLLSETFEYTSPYVGPIRKDAFLEKYASRIYSELEPEYENFRIDLYDVYRVWADVKPKSKGYSGHLQAVSFTFDIDGYCTRLTADYVIDPTIGNGGGLGAQAGLKYARGKDPVGISSRPIPRILSRISKLFTSPITGIGVDDYVSSRGTDSAAVVKVSAKKSTLPKPKEAISIPVPKTASTTKLEKPKRDDPEALAILKNAAKSASISLFGASSQETVPNKGAQVTKQTKQRDSPQAIDTLRNAAERASISLEGMKKQIEKAGSGSTPTTPKKTSSPVISKTPGPKTVAPKPRITPSPPKTKVPPAAKPKKSVTRDDPKALETLKNAAKSASISLMKLAGGNDDMKPSGKASSKTVPASKSVDDKKAISTVKSAAPGGTISLLGLGSNSKDDSSSTPSKAPQGVPQLRRWRKNPDGSITGRIFGSSNFDKGAEVTTSPIKSGKIESGSTVRTGSGSRYYLD